MADDGRAKVGSGIVAIANNSADGKLGIVVAVTNDLADKVSAVDLVQAGSEAVGGKGGGGRPDMAQAGGPDGSQGRRGARRHRSPARRCVRPLCAA